jgi:hypothetical protein
MASGQFQGQFLYASGYLGYSDYYKVTGSSVRCLRD